MAVNSQAEAVHWSEEKQTSLFPDPDGFWARKRWIMSEAPVRWAGRIHDRKSTEIVCISPGLQAEIRYVCRYKLERREWAVEYFIRGQALYVKRICRWLDEVTPHVRSLLERSLEYWELSLRTYLVERGLYHPRTSSKLDSKQQLRTFVAVDHNIGILRNMYEILMDFYDERAEFEKDVWRGERLGFEVSPGTKLKLLNFTYISQPWLRQAVKDFIRMTSMGQSLSGCAGKICNLNVFSQFLEDNYPDVQPRHIDRPLVERYIEAVNSEGLGKSQRHRRLNALNLFFEACVEYDILPISKERLIRRGDFPKIDRPLPRYIPEPVLRQLHEHMHELPTGILRMLLIIEETGMRVSELCGLRSDCLRGPDSDGDWWLFFRQYKMRKEHSVPLLTTQSEAHRKVVAAIQAQIYDVRNRWGDDCEWLFPNSKGLPWGAEHFCKALNKLAVANGICDPATGKVWHFESHQFRHTLGFRLINAGVPHSVIQHVFGHESPQMVEVYAHVVDETAKRELGAYHRKVVDIHGRVRSGDPRLETADLQHFKQNVRGQALMIGTCGLPVYFQRCPHANACLTCTHWRISSTDLPLLSGLLEREERILALARTTGNREAIEVGEELVLNLHTIIDALQKDGSLTEPTVLDGMSPGDTALNGLKKALVEAEVGLAQARSQGTEEIVNQRKAKISALKAQVAALERKPNGK